MDPSTAVLVLSAIERLVTQIIDASQASGKEPTDEDLKKMGEARELAVSIAKKVVGGAGAGGGTGG